MIKKQYEEYVTSTTETEQAICITVKSFDVDDSFNNEEEH